MRIKAVRTDKTELQAFLSKLKTPSKHSKVSSIEPDQVNTQLLNADPVHALKKPAKTFKDYPHVLIDPAWIKAAGMRQGSKTPAQRKVVAICEQANHQIVCACYDSNCRLDVYRFDPDPSDPCHALSCVLRLLKDRAEVIVDMCAASAARLVKDLERNSICYRKFFAGIDGQYHQRSIDGVIGFKTLWDHALWDLRDCLDPACKSGLRLPDEADLHQILSALRYQTLQDDKLGACAVVVPSQTFTERTGLDITPAVACALCVSAKRVGLLPLPVKGELNLTLERKSRKTPALLNSKQLEKRVKQWVKKSRGQRSKEN